MAVLVAACAAIGGTASAATATTPGATLVLPQETRQLDALYEDALREGGKVVLWSGGDAPDQMDGFKATFERRFPGVQLDVLVDLSKFHDIRIDQELAAGRLTPDVAMLQTTFDFDKWKKAGVLMNYKPVGFAQQKPGYADPDGAFVTAWNYAFVPTYARSLRLYQRPQRLADFDRRPLKGRLVLPWPHDDDAVLYVFDKIEKAFGTGYLQALAAQRPRFYRGTAVPSRLVGRSPSLLGNLTGYPLFAKGPSRHLISTTEPFIVWNQRAAIFKAAQRPAGAKLLMSYLGSAEFQSTYNGWRARGDVGEAPGLPPLESLNNVDVHDFTRWMSDRANVARLRQHMADIFGPVTGESPLRDPHLIRLLGLTPDRIVAPPAPSTPPY
jgi:ABC-type Fe3+ transport system substrate-binding protein